MGLPHGTPKRGTERELSGLERSEHKRKTIKVLRALRVAPREGRASLGTEGSVEPGGPSVTTPGETLAPAFRSVELFSQLIERPLFVVTRHEPTRIPSAVTTD